MARGGTLTCDFGSEGGHGTSAACAVAMFWREIGSGESFEGIAGGLINDVDPVLAHASYGTAAGLGYEVFLGFKVTVEAAVGEACGLHEIGDADAVDAALAKQTSGDVQDSLVIFCFLLTADSHDAALSGACFEHANYMTCVMLKRCSLRPALVKFCPGLRGILR